MDWIVNILDWAGWFKFWQMIASPLGLAYFIWSWYVAQKLDEANEQIKNLKELLG